MTNGYNFYFKIGTDVLTFPITPGELNIKVGSNNKVVTLINEGDINILKSPSLIEVEFEARFPMREYPYSRWKQADFEKNKEKSAFKEFYDVIKVLKEERKSFRFIVTRTTPNGKRTWDTNLLMALEDFELQEDAGEGDDVLISFKLKQYKEYGVKKVTIKQQTSTATTTTTTTTDRTTDDKTKTTKTHIIKSGENLWVIAKTYYGNGNKMSVIYKANKSIIEETAKKNGKKSSSNGHWVYAGTKLTIPAL